MQNRMFMKGIVMLAISCVSMATFAASIEGYWKSIDDRTSEQLAIVEIKKTADGTFRGKTVYVYPNVRGGSGNELCIKCPPPYTNKPRLGLEFMTGLVQDPKDPESYIHGKLLEPKSGKIYNGKARLSPDGNRLKLRGYMGVSLLGRSVVWIRTDSAKP